MSSKGKGAPRNPLRKTGKSRSAKAGLTFPVSRILSKLRNGEYSSRVGQSAPVFLAAVLEYLTAEILELSGNAARDNHKMRVNPRHIQLAIRNDDELNRLLDNVIVPEGGVNPHIHLSLMPKGSGSSSSSKDKTEKSPTSPKKAPQKRKAAGSTASSSSSSSAAPEKGEPKAKKAKKSKSSSSSSSADPSGPMWQYSDNGWKNYDKEANDVVEQAYQDYLNNPGLCDVRAVKSGQWHYQVDFLNWKQTNVDHNNHTSRSIRRVTPSAVAEAPPS